MSDNNQSPQLVLQISQPVSFIINHKNKKKYIFKMNALHLKFTDFLHTDNTDNTDRTVIFSNSIASEFPPSFL